MIYKFLEVTEAAAIAACAWVGKGDEKAADRAAVDAMRAKLSTIEFDGTVVIGEGERDEAPMLFIGEKVGMQKGTLMDVAVDPLEGTTICAQALPNSLSVMAIADRGCFLHAPDVYMDKIAVGPGLPEHIIDLDLPTERNIHNLAQAKNCNAEGLRIAVLKRERHLNLVGAIRKTGARVILLGDGDIVAAIATCLHDAKIDMYMGIGGAPEGVLAAAAIKSLGGQMQGRLHFVNEQQKERATHMGIDDVYRKYACGEMARGRNIFFVATGVTDGILLEGVKYKQDGKVTTSSMIISNGDQIITKVRREHM
ncbi:Fructose-1,6-bisphosphatase class 2 [Alphaproteobacteria bacterium]